MKKWISLLLVLLFAGLTGSCGLMGDTKHDIPKELPIQSKGIDEKPLRVAVQAHFCSSMVGLITEQEWDKQAGIPFELVIYPDGNYLNQGLKKGEWDVAVTGGAFIYALADYDALLIGHQIDGTGCNSIYVWKDSKVLEDKGFNPTCPDVYGSPATVKGLEILQNDGTTSSYLLARWLESIGVRRKDIQTIDSEFSDICGRFYAGEGDCAAITTSKGVYDAKGYGWVEAASFETLDITLLESLICTRDAYQNRYEDISTFLQLIYMANDILLENKELQYDVVEKWYAYTGNTNERNAVENEVDNKRFIGTEEAKELNMLDFVMNYAESYVKMGVLSPDDLTVIRENIVVDMTRSVLGGV